MAKLTVVISQSQGKNPAKRQLEEELAAKLLMEPGIDVSVVPHLYDMGPDHTGMLFLRSVPGHMVVLGWLYPRALRWVLDRQGVRGQEGISLLEPEDDEESDEAEGDAAAEGIGSVDVPNRRIYCIDFRARPKAGPYIEEVRRIAQENSQQLVDLLEWVGGSPSPGQMERYLNPLPIVADVGAPRNNGVARPDQRDGRGERARESHPAEHSPVTDQPRPSLRQGVPPELQGVPPASEGLKDFSLEEPKRRWYPVIDYSRCTNCMECIDFCLFGVYGVDTLDRILVEAQDNCKKGCPACSRVCPENAIIFPQHKTPAIAGADGEIAGLKIDLSQLFGGPGKDALELAVAERDVELLRDGRDAVGMSIGIPKRQAHQPPRAKDDLDVLMDGLDALDV